MESLPLSCSKFAPLCHSIPRCHSTTEFTAYTTGHDCCHPQYSAPPAFCCWEPASSTQCADEAEILKSSNQVGKQGPSVTLAFQTLYLFSHSIPKYLPMLRCHLLLFAVKPISLTKMAQASPLWSAPGS